MSREHDSGNGFYGGRPASWDTNEDGTTNIFPGGVPGAAPHDHIVINQDGGVEYMRENGEIINDYRDYRG